MTTTFKLALGGGGPNIHTVSFSGGKLDVIVTVEAARSSWLVPHPTAQGVFFATGELDGGVVRAVLFDETGKAEVVGQQSSAGMHPTHLAVSNDDTELFVANVSKIISAIICSSITNDRSLVSTRQAACSFYLSCQPRRTSAHTPRSPIASSSYTLQQHPRSP